MSILVRLTLAVTDNKAGRQSLDKFFVHFLFNYFYPGQLYVALSPITKSEDSLHLHKTDVTTTGADLPHQISFHCFHFLF